jgi:hypothetical protein
MLLFILGNFYSCLCMSCMYNKPFKYPHTYLDKKTV